MTDPLGQSQVLPYLAGLSEIGYNITLLSCEKPERSQYRDTVQAICTKHHINWQPIPYNRKPPVLATMKDIKHLKKVAFALHEKIRFDIVHCRSYVAALIGLAMKKQLNTAFVFDMRGFWANERVDGGLWRLSNPLYKNIYNYFKKKEKMFLCAADAVVSLTYAGKAEIETWGLPHAPIHVIPCCVDTVLFDPEKLDNLQRAKLRRKADLPDNKVVLGYVGSLGTWYMLDEMMAFFVTWKKTYPNSIFFFVTNEPKELIAQAASRYSVGMEELRIISASRAEMPYYISMIDIGLFFILNAYSKKASSPVKQGEMMAMGVPLICNAGVGDSDLIIEKYRSGQLVREFSATGYQDAILRMKEDINHPEQIREGCLDYFDLKKGILAYDAIYKSVLVEEENTAV